MDQQALRPGQPAFDGPSAKSKYVLTRQFYTPYTEHAFLEPECAVAYPDGDGVMILSTDQGAYDCRVRTYLLLAMAKAALPRWMCLWAMRLPDLWTTPVRW